MAQSHSIEISKELVDFVETRDYYEDDPIAIKHIAEIKKIFNSKPKLVFKMIDKLAGESKHISHAEYLYYFAEKLPEDKRERLLRKLYDFNPAGFRDKFIRTDKELHSMLILMPNFSEELNRAAGFEHEVVLDSLFRFRG